MNPTSRAILQSVIATDSSLTVPERDFVQRLISGETSLPGSTFSAADEQLLVTQKRAAELLSVSRATIWRMAKDLVLHPVEILPGTWRYPFSEIARLARGDRAPETRSSRGADSGRLASAA